MPGYGLFLLICGCVLLTEAPVSGGEEAETDCGNQITQLDMNICAARDFREADAALNTQYQLTKKAVAGHGKAASDALLAAQRAWIAYRDAQCDTVGFQAKGGSMEPMLVSACLAEVTRARTGELRQLAGGF